MAPFHALFEGQIDDHGETRTLTVHDLGTLQVPSGKVEASDPFVNLGRSGVVVDVPPAPSPGACRSGIGTATFETDGEDEWFSRMDGPEHLRRRVRRHRDAAGRGR